MVLRKPTRNDLVSETERESKRTAVNAVEGRWKRAEKFRRRMAFRKFLNNVIAVVLLGAIAFGAVYWYQNRENVGAVVGEVREMIHPGEKPAEGGPSRVVPAPLLDDVRHKPLVEKVVETVVTKPDPAAAFRERYVRLLSAFSEKPLSAWKQTPAAMRPKNAPPGTVYHALVPRRPVGYDIYAMTVGTKEMTYDLLSPIEDAIRVKASDFKAACANATYLIEKDGQVYWAGKASAESAKSLQGRLKTARGAGVAK